MIRRSSLYPILALLLLSSAFSVQAEPKNATAIPDLRSLDDEVQQLKKDTLAINQELFILEEELLFPTNTQTAVFVSLDNGRLFKLDAVKIKLDGKVVSNYLYTEHELAALRRGGIQRIWFGNLPAGEHELMAVVTGLGPKGREFRRAANLTFAKKMGPKYLELKIIDDASSQQALFKIKEWD